MSSVGCFTTTKRTAMGRLNVYCRCATPGHPLFPTRLPGYALVDCVTKAFDGFDFHISKGPKHREEGKFTFLTYGISDRKCPSGERA